MKLRISQNSIRLRLSRGEVARLADAQAIQITTDLVPQRLVYRITPSRDCVAPEITFENGLLDVILPMSIVQAWADTDQVGIQSVLAAGSSELTLLIEKDFKCLHGDGSDDKTNPIITPTLLLLWNDP